MAASLPAVVIDDVAFRTLVCEGLNGLFFKDEESCQEVILKLYKDEFLRQQLARQAEIQSEHCSTSQFADNVLLVYKRAIETKNKNKYGIFSTIANYWRKR